MATTGSTGPRRSLVNLGATLGRVATRLAGSQALKEGRILVRATGPGGGDYWLECSGQGMYLLDAVSPDLPPVIEVAGDARRIQAIRRRKLRS